MLKLTLRLTSQKNLIGVIFPCQAFCFCTKIENINNRHRSNIGKEQIDGFDVKEENDNNENEYKNIPANPANDSEPLKQVKKPARYFKITSLIIDFDSLSTYKSMYGNLLVPYKFSFCSSSANPLNLGPQAYRLGKHVSDIRTFVQENVINTDRLEEMGFVWNVIEYKFQLLVKNLRTYHYNYGNYEVPYSFVIPSGDDRWDKETWGKKLGYQVHIIKSKFKMDGRADRLKEYDILLQPHHDAWAQRIEVAIQTYQSLYNSNSNNSSDEGYKPPLNIRYDFVIPENDIKWPRHTWGLKLGSIVKNIRYRGDYPNYHDRFKKLGVSFEPYRDFSAQKIERALQTYKSIYYNSHVVVDTEESSDKVTATDNREMLKIPQSFVVPKNDDRWPSDTWGLKLGSMVSNIRHRGDFCNYHDRFKKLGFSFEPYCDLNAQKIERALQTYKSIYYNNYVAVDTEQSSDRVTATDNRKELQIPYKFIVPENDDKWPRDTWGLKLGSIVSDIRNSGCYPEYHDRFKKLGVTFESYRDLNAQKIELALQTYKSIYYDNHSTVDTEESSNQNASTDIVKELQIPSKFIVPENDDKWPRDTWGLNLGSIVNSIRNNGYYPEYHDEFRKLGLVISYEVTE